MYECANAPTADVPAVHVDGADATVVDLGLVARLHVDLLRVASAACRSAR